MFFTPSRTPDIKSLWSNHREEFLKLYHAEQFPDKPDLVKAYVDGNGKTYFKHQGGQMSMNLERLQKLMEFSSFISLGGSREELVDLFEVAHANLALIMAQKKADIGAIGAVFKEFESRLELIMHPDLLYNFIATIYIREDEPANKWIQHIHEEKVEQFKKDNENQSTFFFFQVPELKMLTDMLRFTPEEWDKHWQNSILKLKGLKQWGERKLQEAHLASLSTKNSSVKGNRTTTKA